MSCNAEVAIIEIEAASKVTSEVSLKKSRDIHM